MNHGQCKYSKEFGDGNEESSTKDDISAWAMTRLKSIGFHRYIIIDQFNNDVMLFIIV